MIASRRLWIPFFIALVVYGRAVMGTFHFDDYALLIDPSVTSPDGWLDCFRLAQTRPLTWLSFWVNYQVGGASPSGYLALNILLHALNSRLIGTAKRQVVSENVAFSAALLFAGRDQPLTRLLSACTLDSSSSITSW